MKNVEKGVLLTMPLKWALLIALVFVFVFGDAAQYIGTQFFTLIATFNTANHVRILGGIVFLAGTYIWGDNVLVAVKWIIAQAQTISLNQATAKK